MSFVAANGDPSQSTPSVGVAAWLQAAKTPTPPPRAGEEFYPSISMFFPAAAARTASASGPL